MKKLIFLFVLIGFGVHSQDTIRFRNGEVKAVKVTEVGVNDIKYNRFDNVGGPVYITPKNDVRYIKYSVGEIDSFPIVKAEVKQITQQQQPQNLNTYTNPNGCDRLLIDRRNKIFCNGNGRALSESRFRNVLLSLPEGNKKASIMKAYTEMKAYQKKQYQFGFGGLILLVAIPTIGAVATVVVDDITPYGVGIVTGGIAALAGAIISKEFKKKRMAKRYQIVKMYNDEYNFQK